MLLLQLLHFAAAVHAVLQAYYQLLLWHHIRL
jgi:hypothetical protein